MEQQNDILAEEKSINTLVEQELDVSYYFDGDKFIPERLANDIISKYIFLLKGNELYFYENGIYKLANELVRYEIKKRLGDKASSFRTKETIFDIESQSIRSIEELPINYINLKNGLYNLDTETLESHNSDYFTITQIPVYYEPSAIAMDFPRFLSEVINEKDFPIIQEWFGYCLYRDYPIHKAVMCLGEGSNGKSTLINFLKIFIGRENCANIPLQVLSERFASSNLIGKLVNFYSDLSSKAFSKTGMFKILTGQDTLMAEKKFGGWIQFNNFAKLIFSCNKLPEVSNDDSDAFYRRWIFINFPNTFIGENADKDILNKLNNASELSGVLNWALEGLKKLLEQNTFSYSKSTDEIRQQYDRLSNPVKSFILDNIERTNKPEDLIIRKELYEKFIEYAIRENLSTCSDKKFHTIMSQETFKSDRKMLNGKQKYCYYGIKYKENNEHDNDNEPNLNNYL